MTSTETLTLADFLLARIAEDEVTARGAYSYSPWRSDRAHYVLNHAVIAEVENPEDGAHIARWHPARVLAECEAKRRIMTAHPDAHECPDASGMTAFDHPCLTLRLLALPYAGHPDFRPEWRPQA